ncbi:MAG: hypothetical protein ACE5JR_07330 [Gemmatimonadota bacterium]
MTAARLAAVGRFLGRLVAANAVYHGYSRLLVGLLGLFGISLKGALALAAVGRVMGILVVAVPGALLGPELVPKAGKSS